VIAPDSSQPLNPCLLNINGHALVPDPDARINEGDLILLTTASAQK